MIDASHESFDENIATTKRVVDARPREGHQRRGRTRAARRSRGARQRFGGQGSPDRPEAGRGVHRALRLRQPGVRDRHQPRRVQVLRLARGCTSRSSRVSRSSCPASRWCCTALRRSRRTRSSGSTPPAARSRARRASTPTQYLPAAKLGVCKINIDTDGRLVWTRVHREFFRDKPEVFDFRPVGKVFMDEYAKFIASRNELLGSAGQLDEVRTAIGK